MEVIRCKIKRIKMKASTTKRNTKEKETELWLDEIIKLSDDILEETDEVREKLGDVMRTVINI